MLEHKGTTNSIKADLEKKFVSYISTLLHFNSINFDKKIRKHNERYALVLDDMEESYIGYEDEKLLELNSYRLENQISDPNLHKFFLKLSEREKEILNFTFVEEKKDTEIAEKLGVSQQSVSKTRKNALKKLRNFLTKERSE
ncbi:sigma-70 family RNA polymerase sigma factor [Paenibacillus xylanexedens]|uniref:sigma-70 family RNA polymerase sigma factor n=1 Tax=Paenibacillus xylanexedens TaxID=528191 RepID=UPI0011A1177C|nr:sigma-70 family RNA polymerase sigma factor [Paenibacillus xylanexedens]